MLPRDVNLFFGCPEAIDSTRAKTLTWLQLERRPFVISASGSLDLVDLHGVGGLAGTLRDQPKAVVASATAQFH